MKQQRKMKSKQEPPMDAACVVGLFFSALGIAAIWVGCWGIEAFAGTNFAVASLVTSVIVAGGCSIIAVACFVR